MRRNANRTGNLLRICCRDLSSRSVTGPVNFLPSTSAKPVAGQFLLTSVRCLSNGSTGSSPNYYSILGIKHDASIDDIKSAYYNKSKLHHPDLSKDTDAQVRFQLIQEAYEVLGNTVAKSDYDRLHGFGLRPQPPGGRAPPRSSPPPGPSSAFDPFRRGSYEARRNFEDMSPEDFAEFQRIWRTRQRERPRDPTWGDSMHTSRFGKEQFRKMYGNETWQELNDSFRPRGPPPSGRGFQDPTLKRAWVRAQKTHHDRQELQTLVTSVFGIVFAVFAVSVLLEIVYPYSKPGKERMTRNERFWSMHDVNDPYNRTSVPKRPSDGDAK